MLKHLNLKFIDEVLNLPDGKGKVSQTTQLLYIRIILKHFRSLEPKLSHLNAFIIKGTDLPYIDWFPELEELKAIKLIEIDKKDHQYTYRVLNTWDRFIDKTTIEPTRVDPNCKTIHRYQDEIMRNSDLTKVACVKEGLLELQVLTLKEVFILEQKATDKVYKDLPDAKAHFLSWLKTNKQVIPEATTKVAKGTPIKKQQ